MAYSKQTTREKWIELTGYEPVDSEGTPIDVGDTLEIIDRITNEWNVGNKATIAYFQEPYSYVGLIFDQPSAHGKKITPDCPPGCGYEIAKWKDFERYFTKIDKTKTPEQREETLIAKIIEEVKQAPRILAIDGKYYDLILAKNQKAEELVNPLTERFAQRIRDLNERNRRALEREKAKVDHIFAMPEVTIKHLESGLRLWKQGTQIVYSMPFKYQPRYLAVERRVAKLEIDKEWREKNLYKDLFCLCWVPKDGHISGVNLYFDWQGSKTFSDYNCTGDLHNHLDTKNFDDVLNFKNLYEKFCEVINIGHGHYPNALRMGMPSIEEVKKHAHKTEAGQVWDTKDKTLQGLPKEELTEYDFEEGQLVRVIGITDNNEEILGSIGKIITANNIIERFEVEFLFRHEYGQRTWWIDKKDLEPTKRKTRNRKALDPEERKEVEPIYKPKKKAKPEAKGTDKPGRGWNLKEIKAEPAKEEPVPRAEFEFRAGDKVQIAVPEGEFVPHGRAGITNDQVGIVQEDVNAGRAGIVRVNWPMYRGWTTEAWALKLAEEGKGE